MKYTKAQKVVTIFLTSVIWFACGCSIQEVQQVQQYTPLTYMENTPVVDYVVPQVQPNILINMQGYQADSRKRAVIKGERLPNQFQLMDSETKEVVYEGTVGDVAFYEELGSYVASIDFSEYTEEGTYYLQCDYIGKSYSFTLTNTFYQELFETSFSKCVENCNNMKMNLEDAVTLLAVYEWYPEVFGEVQEGELPKVLECFADWIKKREDLEIYSEETLYAAFLAKFSYLYKEYDKKYATQCLNKASNLFEKAQKTSKDAQRFFALTELYRATGLYTYRKQIVEYKSYFESNTSYFEEEEYIYGAITYMITRRKVDVELCDLLIHNIMDRGEEVAGYYQGMIDPIAPKNNGEEDIRKKAKELACANFIMSNYQYHKILEDFLHYLMGRNMQCVSFYQEPQTGTEYLLVLAQLITQEKN